MRVKCALTILNSDPTESPEVLLPAVESEISSRRHWNVRQRCHVCQRLPRREEDSRVWIPTVFSFSIVRAIYIPWGLKMTLTTYSVVCYAFLSPTRAKYTARAGFWVRAIYISPPVKVTASLVRSRSIYAWPEPYPGGSLHGKDSIEASSTRSIACCGGLVR